MKSLIQFYTQHMISLIQAKSRGEEIIKEEEKKRHEIDQILLRISRHI